jgi:aspartyl-tRNA synthetase
MAVRFTESRYEGRGYNDLAHNLRAEMLIKFQNAMNEKQPNNDNEDARGASDVNALVIQRIEMTCSACPTQWEVKLECGKMAYIRYRWGYLSLRISAVETDDIMVAVGSREIYGKQLGDEFDGTISFEQMKSELGHLLDFSAV